MKVFPYQWLVKENEIHCFGINTENENVLVRVEGFTPYLYIKLPNYVDWTSSLLQQRLLKLFSESAPISAHRLMYKKPLYYANVVYENGELVENKEPYFLVSFANDDVRKRFLRQQRRRINVLGIGSFEVVFYEYNASPILQLTCARNISTSDWIEVRTPREPVEKLSRCPHEYCCFWKSLDVPAVASKPPIPTLLSWDIETYSHNPNKLADGTHPDDVVFQISCVFRDAHGTHPFLLTLGTPDDSLLKGTTVRTFRTEYELLLGFKELVLERDPNVIMGYNIFNFDIPYVLNRVHQLSIADEFYRMGITYARMEVKPFKENKMANNNATVLEIPGRMVVDLLVLIKKDKNLESYSLNAVSEKFLGNKKDPLNHLDIFMCYRRGLEESQHGGVSTSLGVVGKYCVKDSALVLDLYDHFQYWISLIEMAKICQLQPSHLFLHGQQLKIFSQVYLYCFYNGIVVESGGYQSSPKDKVKGAHVFEPLAGIHDNVVSFDFASLYPSIIISHNIDYTTLVKEESVPDEFCRVVKWSEHVNCQCDNAEIKRTKTYQCADYKYRWLKTRIGVIPAIIKNLIEARKDARQQMKQYNQEDVMWSILNNRQLAYKVSANSMYGAMAVMQGYLPFLPGGMSITAIGRKSVERVSEVIRNDYKGVLIYGDTDSNYVRFPHLSDRDEIWEWCHRVADGVSALFPAPMRLEFEDKIYTRFIILTKKRYMYYYYDGEQEHRDVIGFTGVLLKRRDNPKAIRHIYERIARMILDAEPEEVILRDIYSMMEALYTRSFPVDFYSISKSIKGVDEFPIDRTETETDRIKYGTYKVREVPDDQAKKSLKFAQKNVDNDDDYYRKQLPVAVQLALRMRDRGQFVESGSRLSYVITNRITTGTQSEKAEDAEYFEDHYPKYLLDSDYYLEQLKNPIETLLTLVFGAKHTQFITRYLKQRMKFNRVIAELTQFRLVFETTTNTVDKYFSKNNKTNVH
jgi:DNA polymerase elongation subunit (family B)